MKEVINVYSEKTDLKCNDKCYLIRVLSIQKCELIEYPKLHLS